MVSGDKFASGGACRLCNIRTAEYGGDGVYALVGAKLTEVGDRFVVLVLFVNQEVLVAACCNLRQMRDGDNLVLLREQPHHGSHLVGGLPGNARVYFVENHGRE